MLLADALNVLCHSELMAQMGLMSEREELTEDGSDLPHELDKERN